MKLVRYAVAPALAAMLFGFVMPARADSVGLGVGPGGVYFDYHAGYGYHRYYTPERRYWRDRDYWRHRVYRRHWRDHDYHSYWYGPRVYRFYWYEAHRHARGDRGWHHRRGDRDDWDRDD